MSTLQKASPVSRMGLFIGDRFPLHKHAPLLFLSFFAHYWSFQALQTNPKLTLDVQAIIGALSIVLLAFLMRVYDELKDVDTDLRLGKAGDPQFKDRPIVTGAITKQDIVNTRWLATAVLLLLNAYFWGTPAFLYFGIVFIFMWFSFQWFFWPKIKTNILLAFVTHNPVIALYGLYIWSVSANESALGLPGLAESCVIVALWMPIAIWEISRKIRLPEDETDYQTYSIMLGWQRAVIIVITLALISTLCMLYVGWVIGLNPSFLAIAVVSALIFIGRCMQLLVAPNTKRAKLLPFAELFAVLANLNLAVFLMLNFGITNAL